MIKNQIPEIFNAATFDEIKSKLLDWLGNQEEFKDYDFLGSRINVLTDMLAYTTLYIQQFANAAQFESFIRTAVLRSSVVQHAQDLGYMPDSKTASSTTLMITAINPLNPTTIRIPRGTKFVASVEKTTSYPFVTLEDIVVLRGQDNTYTTMATVAQGRIVRTQVVFDGKTQILIRDPDIDRSRVKVWVDGSPWYDWTNKSMVHATGASNIFYMRETIDGFTEIYFGEGEIKKSVTTGVLEADYIGGLKPSIGASVVIEYLSTKGEEANGCRDFAYTDTITNLTVTNILENPTQSRDYVGTTGGGNPEFIERIRELAPIMRETQRRCVTATDYEAFVSERFGSVVQAVQCFTDKDKPGYAFIAVKPKQGLRLTSVQKEDMQDYLKQFNMATVTPSILDPNYLYVTQHVKVTYSISELGSSEEWLKGRIIDAIDNYYTNEVEIFNKNFSKSKMLANVDGADASIIGSSAEIGLVREVDNFYKAPMSGIKFLNPVQPMTVISSEFNFTNSLNETYAIRYASTAVDESGKGKIIAGPFKAGDITAVSPYSKDDFVKSTTAQEWQTEYFEVGEIDHVQDYIYYDLGVLDKPSTTFTGAFIEIHAVPTEQNIFTRDGSLIVFENDLRPQYTTIEMEPIAN